MPTDPLQPLNGQMTAIRIGGQHGYEWPAESAEIQKRVQVDFQAEPDVIVHQDPRAFEAIKPIGPYYEYRQYGFVESLQIGLARSVRTSSHW